MSVPEQLAAKIQEWLTALIADPDPRANHLRSLALHFQALPIYADMGGCIAIRPDGELICIDVEAAEWTNEIELKWRMIALAHGSRTHPELGALLPLRGVEDVACATCAGTGASPADSVISGLICGDCDGLGWRAST